MRFIPHPSYLSNHFFPGSLKLQTMFTSGHTYLLDLLNTSSASVVLNGHTKASHEKANRCWRRWRSFLVRLGTPDDPYLSSFSQTEKTSLCQAFLQSIRAGNFSRPSRYRIGDPKELLGRSIQETISYMAQKFQRDIIRPSLFHVPGHPGILEPSINKLLKAWTNIDPPPRRAQAITPKHLHFLHLYG